MNIGAPWPTVEEAESRVLEIQTKLHQWATENPGRRFDDLYNLPGGSIDRLRRHNGASTPGRRSLSRALPGRPCRAHAR